MNQTKTYRDNGAIGALLDEYEKSINELIEIVQDISSNDLVSIIDHETDDEDCKSIQTILTHVVRAGYTYIIAIRKWKGEDIQYRERVLYNSSAEYILALKKMFNYSEQLFEDFPNIEMCENDPAKKIHVSWGQRFDVDQLLEHAIVHILRHRRQIERFLIKSYVE